MKYQHVSRRIKQGLRPRQNLSYLNTGSNNPVIIICAGKSSCAEIGAHDYQTLWDRGNCSGALDQNPALSTAIDLPEGKL